MKKFLVHTEDLRKKANEISDSLYGIKGYHNQIFAELSKLGNDTDKIWEGLRAINFDQSVEIYKKCIKEDISRATTVPYLFLTGNSSNNLGVIQTYIEADKTVEGITKENDYIYYNKKDGGK